MQEALDKLNLYRRAKDWLSVETAARAWLQESQFYLPHLFLIEALVLTGREEEADSEFENLLAYKFNLADRMEGFPDLERRYRHHFSKHHVMSTMRPAISFEGQAIPDVASRWDVKHKTSTRPEFCQEAGRLLDAALPPIQKQPSSQAAVCTFGSCFAANLSRVMIEQGMNASSLLIEESINSTYANRFLLETVCGEGNSAVHAEMLREFGEPFFDKIKEKLEQASHIVLTIGVAPAFFGTDDNEFVFAKNYRQQLRAGKVFMRSTSCAENVDNINRILILLNRLSYKSKIILTVSPVPLLATTEMSSAVVADCISKSTLRAAVQEVVSHDNSVLYFPAFEIVRWLSGYTKTGVYGADDDNSRHVSNWVVELIVKNFMDRFFD